MDDDDLKELYDKTGTDEFRRLGLSLDSDKGFDGKLGQITAASLRAVFNAGKEEERNG